MELKTGAWRRCCRLAEIVFTSPWLIPTVAVGLIGWGTLRLASSSSDSAPEVSSPRALDAKHVFPNGAAIRNLVLSADGESLDVIRSGHSADEIAEWQRISAHTGRELQHRPLSRSRLHRTQLTGKNFWAAVDHRGHLLASNDARPLWEGRLPQQADGESVVQVALCAEPQRIAAVSDQGTLWVLDWSATAVDVRGCYSLGQPISRLAFTTEGKRLAIATAEQKFLVWDVAQEKIVAQFAADGVEFQFVTWSDNGRRALAYDFDHAAIVWDAETGQKVEEWELPSHLFLMNGALSPDGTVAAIGTHDGVFVLELDTDRNYPRLIDGVGAVSALRFSGDNQTLFAGDYRGRVCCWSLANERLVWVSE